MAATGMSEAHFWDSLEFRVSREFAGLPGRRHFWCDGILPDEYMLNGPRPRITGKAWIVDGQKQICSANSRGGIAASH